MTLDLLGVQTKKEEKEPSEKFSLEIPEKARVMKKSYVRAGEHVFYMDGFLKGNLDIVKRTVRNDYDAFIVVAGREGYGKSTLAMQCAMYCDNSFNLDRVVFTAEQFMEAVDKAERYQAIVFDETMGYLSSRGSMSKFNRALIKVMSEMRFKNLIIFLCIPNFFELDRYPAMHRSTGLLLVYRRGAWSSYGYAKKKELYLKGKRYYAYNTKPDLVGCFVKYFPLNKESYEKKKRKAIFEFQKERKSKENKEKEVAHRRHSLKT